VPILDLDHINIAGSAPLIERCRAFYVGVLGLRDGDRPPFRSRGYWLYAGERPVVHLLVRDVEPKSGAALDHFAFRCTGLEAMTTRLEQHAVTFTVDRVPATGRTQLFLTDPAGVGIELNF
jgi:glyoxylase I family protein